MKITLHRFCYICCRPSQVEVDRDQYFRWKSDRKHLMAQEVFKDLTAGERETIISGAHEKCFDEAFKERE